MFCFLRKLDFKILEAIQYQFKFININIIYIFKEKKWAIKFIGIVLYVTIEFGLMEVLDMVLLVGTVIYQIGKNFLIIVQDVVTRFGYMH